MGVTYIAVARLGAVPPGGMLPVEVGGRRLLLAELAGKYFIFARECPHEAADLNTGALSEGQIRCANHGFAFDLASGACVVPPGGPPLTTLAVEVRGEEICVRLEW